MDKEKKLQQTELNITRVANSGICELEDSRYGLIVAPKRADTNETGSSERIAKMRLVKANLYCPLGAAYALDFDY